MSAVTPAVLRTIAATCPVASPKNALYAAADEIERLTAEPSMSDLIVEMREVWGGLEPDPMLPRWVAWLDPDDVEFWGPNPEAVVRAAHAAWKAAQS